MRRSDDILVWSQEGVDCTVKPFCPQDNASFQWECVLGKIGPQAQFRAAGSAQTEEEAVDKAKLYAGALTILYTLHFL